MKVLTLSTYPIRAPRHGGQRRMRALAQLYATLGATVEAVAVYAPHYRPNEVGPNDVRLGYSSELYAGLPFLEDLQAGEFAARSPAAYAHFARLVDNFSPDIVVLEHPFMVPLVRRLRHERPLTARLIYSSHNWEAPLKEAILLRAGLPRGKVSKITQAIEALEREALEMADLIISVSEQDAAIYRDIAPERPVLIAPNGVDRPEEAMRPDNSILKYFESRKYLFFVGSAYPPNIEGFNRLVAEEGLFFTPPVKSFAICGGACDQIFQSGSYQRFVGANSDRVHFFPNIDDADLLALKANAHAILLPIQFGGGSNLKTAEALLSGKWVVTTSLALRGFEKFTKASGVLVADTPRDFRHAMIDVLSRGPLQLAEVEKAERGDLIWDKAFALSGVTDGVREFFRGVQTPSSIWP